MPDAVESEVVADPFHAEPDPVAPLEPPIAPADPEVVVEENPAPESVPAPDAPPEYAPRERRL